MARVRERAVEDLEYGEIACYLGQQLLMQLGERVIVIGRKRITKRFWALVVPRGDFGELVAAGDYRIFRHDGHTHLSFDRPIPTPFPPELQAEFGDRRYSQLDTTGFLDYPGAELVLIAE